MSRPRYVARGTPGGYQIWDTKLDRRWGDPLYELSPDDLLAELNGPKDYARVTDLINRYRAVKR